MQGRTEIWDREMRILWILVGMKEVKCVRVGEAEGVSSDDLPRGVSESERSGPILMSTSIGRSQVGCIGGLKIPRVVFRSLE